jgi:hypothetical protein
LQNVKLGASEKLAKMFGWPRCRLYADPAPVAITVNQVNTVTQKDISSDYALGGARRLALPSPSCRIASCLRPWRLMATPLPLGSTTPSLGTPGGPES